MNQNRLFPYRSSSQMLAVIVRLFVALAAVALPVPGNLRGVWRVAVAAPLAASTTYVVNSSLDEPDADPSNGICFSTPSGKCTLRAAIMEANFATDPNTITVPSGVYVLTRPGYDDMDYVGDLDIAQPLTIQGAGAGVTIVDGNSAVTGDRVFHVLDTAPIVELSGLTIRHGSVPTTGGSAGPSWGGGILLNNQSVSVPTLRLKDVILEGNTALTGGGLYASAGNIDLQNTIVYANAAVLGGAGGGIYAAFGSTLTIHDSQVYSNSANTGGGLALEGSLDTRIERSEFYSNTAESGDGGGIYGTTTFFYPINLLSLVNSNLHDNFAGFNGGAIRTNSTLVLSRTVLNANHAQVNGGGLFATAGNASTVALQESTLSHNTAQFGGAIEYKGSAGALTLVNSTLSDNTVSHDGGGLYASDAAQISLFNVTIAGNALFRQLGQSYPARGGGVFITTTAVITAYNTLIADNVRATGLDQPVPDDCFTSATTSLHSPLGYNLVETTTNCIISGTTFGNVNLDPKLGPLQNNGGSTQTHALLPGSPAIDAGDPAGCTHNLGATLHTDQRGAPRTDVRCDIGAYEVVPEADLSVGQHDSSDPVLVGAPLIYTVTVNNNGPSPSTGVMLSDILPVSVTLSTATSAQGTCIGTVTIICNLGSLSGGTNLTVTVAVTPTATGLITNTVAVTANEFDPVLANNTSNETTAVVHKLYLPLIRR